MIRRTLILCLICFASLFAEDSILSDEGVEAVLQKFGSTCLEAHNPKDLDALWVQLDGWNRAVRNNRAEDLNFFNRHQIAAALEFVGRWKEYLSYNDKGDQEQAENVLEQILQNSNWLSLIPRSQIMALRTEPEPFVAPSLPMSRLEDLETVAEMVKKAIKHPQHPKIYDRYEYQIKNIIDFIGKILNGKMNESVLEYLKTSQNIGADTELSIKYNEMVVAKFLTPYLSIDLPENELPKPGALGVDYAISLMEKARNEKKWDEVWRLLTFLNRLTGMEDSWARVECCSMDQFMKGMYLEMGNCPREAVYYYRAALAFPASDCVSDEILKRLNNIKTNNPNAYAEGCGFLLRFLHPTWERGPWPFGISVERPDSFRPRPYAKTEFTLDSPFSMISTKDLPEFVKGPAEKNSVFPRGRPFGINPSDRSYMRSNVPGRPPMPSISSRPGFVPPPNEDLNSLWLKY